MGSKERRKMNKKIFRIKNTITIISTSVAVILLIYFAYYSKRFESEWLSDNIVAIFVIFLFYFTHKKIEVTEVLYPFALLIAILHNLGTFGFYSKGIFGIEWDFVTHLYSGIILSLITYHCFHKKLKIKTLTKITLTIFVVMGIGSITEIMEVLGTFIFGPGEGFFQYGNGDLGLFDTQMDLIYNLLGIFVGLGIYFLNFAIKNIRKN